MSENKRNKGFNADQILEIKKGIRKEIDTTIYNKVEYDAGQMKQLRLGLEQGMDVSKYADEKYNQYQMEEIRLGLPLDGFEKFVGQNYDAEQLKQLRLGLEQGIDVSGYAVPAYDNRQMEQLRIGLKMGLDIRPFQHPEMSSEQMQSIRYAAMTQSVITAIKEQLNRILQSFLETIKLYISIPENMEPNINSRMKEILSQRSEEIIAEQISAMEKEKEPENMEEVIKHVEQEMGKEEIQEQLLPDDGFQELEDVVQETTGQTMEPAQENPQNKETPQYHENKELNKAMETYVQFRQEIKKPLLQSQITATMAYVATMESDPERQAMILNQSVVKGWKALYPLKEETEKEPQSSKEKKEQLPKNTEAKLDMSKGKESLDQLEQGLSLNLSGPQLELNQLGDINEVMEDLEI